MKWLIVVFEIALSGNLFNNTTTLENKLCDLKCPQLMNAEGNTGDSIFCTWHGLSVLDGYVRNLMLCEKALIKNKE